MYNSVINLISETKKVDKYGDISTVRKNRTVFAELKSIGQSEFYQAQAVGLRPEIKFVIADYLDYQGESKLSYQRMGEEEEQEYTVIRTYRNGNTLEIVCRRGIE